MRLPSSEKLEIIRLVELSDISTRETDLAA
jgi:hypothetical protein